MNHITTVPNADLTVVDGNMTRWTHADGRRHGFHNLYKIARYCSSFRATDVMPLRKQMDMQIAERRDVRDLTALPWFSAMVVIQGQSILYERYAADFGPEYPHSIQSITKTFINLLIGELVDRGMMDLTRKVIEIIPEIGSGYAAATVQQVLDMDVVNDYSEDFSNPQATYYVHEEAMGWRLPNDLRPELTQRRFLPTIQSSDVVNHTGQLQYKDANTAVLAWIVERVSGRPLRCALADVVDAAGLEGTLYITTDRDGFPTLEGGACLTARDLARYFSIFARHGRGIKGQAVGSERFIQKTQHSGLTLPAPNERMRYSNHLRVVGDAVGHSGWGGQLAMANLKTGRIAVFYSVIENQHAIDREYMAALGRMLESITSIDQNGH